MDANENILENTDEFDRQIEKEYHREDQDIMDYVCRMSYSSSEDLTVVSCTQNDRQVSSDSLNEDDAIKIVQSTPYSGQMDGNFIGENIFSEIVKENQSEINVLQSTENKTSADKQLKDRLKYLESQMDALRKENTALRNNLSSSDAEIKKVCLQKADLEKRLEISEQSYEMIREEKRLWKRSREMEDGQFDQIRRTLKEDLFNSQERLRRSSIEIDRKNKEIADHKLAVNALNRERDSLLSVATASVRRVSCISEDLLSIGNHYLTFDISQIDHNAIRKLTTKLTEERLHADRLVELLKDEYLRGKDCQSSRGESIMALAMSIGSKANEETIRFLKTRDSAIQTDSSNFSKRLISQNLPPIQFQVKEIRLDFQRIERLNKLMYDQISSSICHLKQFVCSKIDPESPLSVKKFKDLKLFTSETTKDVSLLTNILTKSLKFEHDCLSEIKSMSQNVDRIQNGIAEKTSDLEFRLDECTSKLLCLHDQTFLVMRNMKKSVSSLQDHLLNTKVDFATMMNAQKHKMNEIKDILVAFSVYILEMEANREAKRLSMVNVSVQTEDYVDEELISMVKSITHSNSIMQNLLEETLPRASALEAWIQCTSTRLKLYCSKKNVPVLERKCGRSSQGSIEKEDIGGSLKIQGKPWYRRYIRTNRLDV
ncbi:hypothetical protein ACOME3_006536 [Neoechinorhynchus agilis]